MRSFEDGISECSTDEAIEKVDHFRRIKFVLENLNEYQRVPNHEESIEELRKINNFLCIDKLSEGIVDLTVNTKEQISNEKMITEEVIGIGDQLYGYCRNFERAELSNIDRQKHCEVLMGFLAMKQSFIADSYRNERSGTLEDHESFVQMMHEIENQRDQINTFMATTNNVGVY